MRVSSWTWVFVVCALLGCVVSFIDPKMMLGATTSLFGLAIFAFLVWRDKRKRAKR